MVCCRVDSRFLYRELRLWFVLLLVWTLSLDKPELAVRKLHQGGNILEGSGDLVSRLQTGLQEN